MAEMKKSANDYMFYHIIGEGSFSTVYLAKEVNDTYNRELAIKVCEKALIRKENKKTAILREKKCFELLIANPSPLFVKFFRTFQDESKLFFVTDFVKKGELLSLMNNRQVFDQNCSRFYSAEILLALEHMHRLGIIHRDLKPENILLNEKMHIQVTDFGSALIIEPIDEKKKDKEKTDDNEKKRKNSFVGTAHYVSPEMLTNEKPTPSLDLWAFGCIVYQMICGSTPFRAPNEYQIFQRIQNLDFDFTEDFDDSAKDFITNILQTTPSQRLGAKDNLPKDGYISIKSDPFFSPFVNKWSIIHEMTPPVSPDSVNNVINTEITSNSSLNDKVEPGLTDRQITRIMGLELHDDFDRSNSNHKKNILDIPEPEMKRRLKKQREINIFHRFVEENLILKQDFIHKTKGLFARKRMFLLTTGPHLYYVDPNNMVLKGQIPWSKDMKPLAKNFKNFTIQTPNRTYILEDTSGNALEWCRIIEEIRDATYGQSCNQTDNSFRKISINDNKLG